MPNHLSFQIQSCTELGLPQNFFTVSRHSFLAWANMKKTIICHQENSNQHKHRTQSVSSSPSQTSMTPHETYCPELRVRTEHNGPLLKRAGLRGIFLTIQISMQRKHDINVVCILKIIVEDHFIKLKWNYWNLGRSLWLNSPFLEVPLLFISPLLGRGDSTPPRIALSFKEC